MPPIDPTILVLAVLAVSLVFFVFDLARYEVIALAVVAVLALTGCLTEAQAFEGFASPALVLIASMYVFGHAFTRWGIAEALTRKTLQPGRGGEASLVVRLVLIAGLLSSFLSNTGVVATLIPVCSGLARQHRIPVSRLLLPMSFGTQLGGLITVIATSKNILINRIVAESGQAPLGLFEFAPYGLGMLLVSGAYFWLLGRRLLPKSPLDQSLAERYQVPKFVTEVLAEPASVLVGRAVADTELFKRFQISILGIVRAGGEGTVLAPGPYNRIRVDDTLILQGQPEDILRMRSELGLREKAWVETSETRLYSDDVRLVEAVLPAQSQLVGNSLRESELRSRTGLNVVAVSKHGQLMLGRMQDTPLEVGDTLLVQGHQHDIERIGKKRELIVLEEFGSPELGRKAGFVLITLLAVLLAANFTSIPLAVSALVGALVLLAGKAVKAQELPSIIGWPVLILIGGMLALGKAFDEYGLDETVADWLVQLGSAGMGPHFVLGLLLVATTVLTQVLNYVSTAVIMTPVALQLAAQLGVDPRPFIMAVISGAEFSFLTPMAHQSNAMVAGPGGYRTRDFLRTGAPLTVLLVAIAIFWIPFWWPIVAAQ